MPPLLVLLFLLLAAFSAEVLRALRWRDRQRFQSMILAGALLSASAAGLYGAASFHPGMPALRWQAGCGSD